MSEKIWANSGDSHLMEPADLWTSALPQRLADRAIRAERGETHETIYLDGEKMTRHLNDFSDAMRPPGARDLDIRLKDLNQEGVWAQLAFPSLGFWTCNVTDRELSRELVRAWNDWAHSEIISRQRRVLPTAIVPLVDLDDAVAEIERVAELGFQCLFLPTGADKDREWGLDMWEPIWTAAEHAGLVLGFHIGTGYDTKVYRGPGAAIVNYVETTYPGMRTVNHMVASGALDRHPRLRVLIAEGGASWVPAVADRMDEAYRQHKMFIRPELSRLPSEIVYEQVYASFQHDVSAIPAVSGMGYRNVMWGDDYPHLEGTYGHTQQTLRELFGDVPAEVRERITRGTFCELFSVPEQSPAEAAL